MSDDVVNPGEASDDRFPWTNTGKLLNAWIGNAANYIGVGTFTVQAIGEIINLAQNAFRDTADQLNTIQNELKAILTAISAADYLQSLRDMEKMRGNAVSLSENARILNQGPNESIKSLFLIHLAQLENDINSLIVDGVSNGFWQKLLVDSAIATDGAWMSVLPDRPPEVGPGTCLEYRAAMPTLQLLINTRITVEPIMEPDFVNKKTLGDNINDWFQFSNQMTDWIQQHVRMVPFTPPAVQCSRILSLPGWGLENQPNYSQHAPGLICAMGAIDISTGTGRMDYSYTQFNEFYFRGRLLPGQPAGALPPCLGADFRPPPQVQNPPRLEDVEAEYKAMFENDTHRVRDAVAVDTGCIELQSFGMNLPVWEGFPGSL
jgi:hypothetical protein